MTSEDASRATNTEPSSGLSPIARVLLNARLGQRVKFKFAADEKALEIVRISYE